MKKLIISAVMMAALTGCGFAPKENTKTETVIKTKTTAVVLGKEHFQTGITPRPPLSAEDFDALTDKRKVEVLSIYIGRDLYGYIDALKERIKGIQQAEIAAAKKLEGGSK